MTNEFPKILYRDGTAFEWEGQTLDLLIVADADEEKAARVNGWRDAIPTPAPRKKG